MADRSPYSITAAELARRLPDDVPSELVSTKHLIYSSPATLAFNSPGAQGFGVKRAGLAIPGSVMLLVAPRCCGRNTAEISKLADYADRFFYLLMDDTDIVTGRHISKIPAAVKEVCESCAQMPTAVMICITCVDALLGTDMERVCRKSTEAAGVPVVPCYMYALTREGRLPPMSQVRKSVYSLLEPLPKRPDAMNIMGFFAPLDDDCELYELMRAVGMHEIREISRCETYDEYLQMAEANFNLVLNPEARYAAQDLEKRLGIPSIELTRVYQLDKIANQYRLFGQAIGVEFDFTTYRDEAKEAIGMLRDAHPDANFSIGEMVNAEPFELALALVRYGFGVSEIFGTVGTGNVAYIRALAELSPDTRIYSNLNPSMLYFDPATSSANVAIGKDARYYHPELPGVEWADDRQPFGFRGLRSLIDTVSAALDEGGAK